MISRKDADNYFIAEFAKSTRPITGNGNKSQEIGSLFRFSDNTNWALSFKAERSVDLTKTRLAGLIRKTGENFQSFSLFNYSSRQLAWMAKAEQPFLKERILFTGILRKNDFINPFTEKTYKTSTLFGSIQLSVRIPKWPAVTIGYYPGTQVYVIDNTRARENAYYILNGTIVYQYALFGSKALSSAVYNKYTSRGTDSGFARYNGISYLLSQSLIFHALQLQGSYQLSDQETFRYYTINASADLKLSRWLRIGAGLMYNETKIKQSYWGGRGQFILDIKRIGSIQLQYEKSFLPTVYNNLFPVETGRLTFFKQF
jgi:hypothetical protein